MAERVCANWLQRSTPSDSTGPARIWEFCLAYAEAGFRAGYLPISAVLPEMLARPGRVIADASGVGYRGLVGVEAYGATQAKQINLLEAVRSMLPATGWSAAHPIVFPARMAILMKAARFVPVRIWPPSSPHCARPWSLPRPSARPALGSTAAQEG